MINGFIFDSYDQTNQTCIDYFLGADLPPTPHRVLKDPKYIGSNRVRSLILAFKSRLFQRGGWGGHQLRI